jgi:hypothetical protein
MAKSAYAIDISTTDHVIKSKQLFVGGAGTLKVTTSTGTTVVFGAVPAGTTLDLETRMIWKVGTSATSLVALI